MARSYVMVKNTAPDSGIGSGIVVRNNARASYVLTCAHVLEEGNTKVVRRTKGHFASDLVELCDSDSEHDLALLVGPHLPGARALQLAEDEPDLYTHAYLMGSHGGLFGVAGDAIITGAHGSHGEAWGKHLYVFTGVACPGMSGGMLCNLDGGLVGVLSQVRTENEHAVHTVGYAVDLPTVRDFLRAALP